MYNWSNFHKSKNWHLIYVLFMDKFTHPQEYKWQKVEKRNEIKLTF